MSLRRIVLGTRGSGLALRQTNEVLEQLRAIHPEADFQVTTIATGGDMRPDEPIASLGIGAFVTELEAALLRSDIDVAVHSLKDLPTAPTPGLHIPAVTVREDPRDCLVDRWDLPLEQLPAGARIGTGSPRRASQLLHLRPDLQVLPIRGNVDTRLKKARGPDFDGVVLAMAGLIRLGRRSEATQPFDPHVMVPAPGQGALALQCREDDHELATLLSGIDHAATAVAVRAERSVLSLLGGGCQLALGAYATVERDTLALTGLLAEEAGTRVFKATSRGNVDDPEGTAGEVFGQLVRQGATVQ
ncbi:MAG: hydroxymethylbilane synthase [Chloroflexi bacterium]|nr:hydroxymethylbilane synthase [Chloroflexota bacterium]